MSNLSFTEAVAAMAAGKQVEAKAVSQKQWYPKNLLTHWFPELEEYRIKPEPHRPDVIWVTQYRNTRTMFSHTSYDNAIAGTMNCKGEVDPSAMPPAQYLQLTPQVREACTKAGIVV